MRDESATNVLAIAAIAYAKRGWRVLPCKPREKRPATAHGYKNATADRGELVRQWKQNPRANIGIATGQISGIIVLDVDPRNGGRESLAELERIHGPLPKTARVETGGDGEHYYFALSAGVCAKSFVLAPGLDVKADAGYVLAPPSLHPNGKPYTCRASLAAAPLAAAPAWLLEAEAKRGRTQPDQPAKTAATTDAADTPLGRVFAESGLLGKALDGGKRSVVCPWQADHTTGQTLDSSTVIFPSSSPGGLGGFHCSHAHCSQRSGKQAFDNLRGRADRERSKDAWVADLGRNKEGRLLRSFRNVCIVLQNDDAYAAALRFDEMNSTVFLNSGEMRDSGISAIRLDLDERYGIAPSEADAVRAVQYVAERNRFHPVRTYLQGLTWDGTARLEQVAEKILNVRSESVADAALLTALVRRWFISLVARPLKPGVKVDSVLILVGRQGCGKSSFFRALGRQWFSDTEMALDKDGLMQLGGSWLYEWGELENMFGRNTTSRIKQFITSDRDKFRPPFGRAPITVLRTSIIVGTTNLDSFLHDATGSRRFWVVPVAAVNLALAREWREQLLAEAVVAFRKGEQHWLTDAEERARQEFVAQFNETDPWEEPVLRYAEQQPHVRIPDVLHDVLGIALDRQARREEQRVAAILRRGGWEPAQRRIQGNKQRLWERRAQ